MSRKPQLKITKSIKLEKVRSVSCTPHVISKYLRIMGFAVIRKHFFAEAWFEKLHYILLKHKLLDRSHAVFNVDESDFLDNPGRLSVVVKRSTKHPVSSHAGTRKRYTTILMCTSANGK